MGGWSLSVIGRGLATVGYQLDNITILVTSVQGEDKWSEGRRERERDILQQLEMAGEREVVEEVYH